jgi:hypothetical protein
MRKRKVLNIFVITLAVVIAQHFIVGQWYRYSMRGQPYQIGTSFVAPYAEYLGTDPKQTLQAIITDLKPDRLRLVSYWDIHEKEQGKYDFSDLDWQLDMAEKSNTNVSLAIGLRQPRWPECHMPSWAKTMDKSQWQPALNDYLSATIAHVKDRTSIIEYQLENEYFLSVFGECPDFDRDRLVSEYNLVKSLDPSRTLVVSRSNNGLGVAVAQPRADKSAISIYKRVWTPQFGGFYFEYPHPSWFYSGLAGWTKILTARDMFVHELQAEPWGPNGQSIRDISVSEQDKSMDASRLKTRIEYAKNTGMRQIDLWGAEWWYWRKAVKNDDSLWQVAKTIF